LLPCKEKQQINIAVYNFERFGGIMPLFLINTFRYIHKAIHLSPFAEVLVQLNKNIPSVGKTSLGPEPKMELRPAQEADALLIQLRRTLSMS
jgi:hypothetical protein